MASALRNAVRALRRPPQAAVTPPAAQQGLPTNSGIKGLTKDDTVIRFMQTQKKNGDIYHRFVTVPDARGNTKTGSTARLSRYPGETTGEHVGCSAGKVGLKSVFVEGKGFTFSNEKKKGALSWGDGFRGKRDRVHSPIISIHDVMTQLAHKGGRLPKHKRK